MGCDACGSGYTGNCSITSPIILVATGPTGPQGTTGISGTNGTTILFSSISSYNSTVGITGETLFSYTLDNTPTQKLTTNGDYLKIKARLRFYDTIDNRGCDIVVNLGAEAVTLPRAQVYNSSYSYLDVEIFLKKVSNSSEGILWQAHYGVGAPYITFNTVSTPIITGALLDFTNDIIITVVATYVDTTTPPGSNIAFTSGTNARIEDIIITKYLQ